MPAYLVADAARTYEFVGRASEVATLVGAVTTAPSLVVVEGEAGVGKTRLIREALRCPEVVDLRVIAGGCRPLRDPLPMGPVVQALTQTKELLGGKTLPRLLGALVPLVPELDDVLPAALESVGEAAADRFRVFRAVRTLLETLGPAVLVLEDLHWADQQTIELLTVLVGEPPPQLRLLLSSRRVGMVDALAVPVDSIRRPTRVSLGPLDQGEVAVLAGQLLSADDVSGEFAAYLYERTAGLPFAVEQLVLSLRDSGHLVQQDGQWLRATVDQLPVPNSVRAIVMQQVGALSYTGRQLAEAMSVVERPATQELLRSVVAGSDDEVANGLSELIAARLFDATENAAYRFRHPLARDAVYQALPEPEQARLHLLVAQLFERRDEPPPVAELMHHFRLAGRNAKWVKYSEAAIDLARSRGNDAEATRLCADILTTADLPAQTRVRIAGKLADSAVQAVAHTTALPLLRAVLAESEMPTRQRGELRFELARLLVESGQLEEGQTELLGCLPDLSSQPGLAARAMSNVALLEVMLGKPVPQLQWLDQARRAASQSGDEAVVMGTEVNRASVLLDRGDPRGWEAAAAIDRETTTTSARRQQLRGYSNLAYAAVRLGHNERAKTYLERARQLVDEGVGDRHEDSLESTAIVLAFRSGMWRDLRKRAERFIAKPLGLPLEALPVRYVRASLLLAGGRSRDAHDELTRLAQDARDARYIELVPTVLSGVVRLALARGRFDEALSAVNEALELVRAHCKWVDLSELAVPAVQTLLSCTQPAVAEVLVEQAREVLAGSDAPAAAAAMRTCQGLLAGAAGRQALAAKLLTGAERAWSDLGRPYDACQAQELHAVGMLKAVDSRGQAMLLEVLERYELLGASWDADRARQVARDHGVSLAHRRGRKSYGNALSPRERQVAELAARGLTNREIAAELFISPRTAGNHVINVMRKLGVDSRRQLGERLATWPDKKQVDPTL